jgi:hypothetical protein
MPSDQFPLGKNDYGATSFMEKRIMEQLSSWRKRLWSNFLLTTKRLWGRRPSLREEMYLEI